MSRSTVTETSVPENVGSQPSRNFTSIHDSRLLARQQRRAELSLSAGQAFNPFNLFDGAMVPSQILRSRDLLPSEKLIFARLTQFAGGKGKAWPSIEKLADEVALSVPQTRRCVSSLEAKGLIRRVARSGRSNEFEFLWHEIYERAERKPQSSVIAPPHSPMSGVPQSPTIAPPRSFMTGAPQSSAITPPQSPVIGAGRSSVIARRESIESSSSEEIQIEKNQETRAADKHNSATDNLKRDDDDFAHKREPLDDPEQEFLLRLQERHSDTVNRDAILQCVLGDLKSFSDLKPFLEFERKQTTAPEKLKNPAGHYRRAVRKFYEIRAKRREWDIREQMRVIGANLAGKAHQDQPSKLSCSLSRCDGSGELWDSDGFVSACECEHGQKLSPKVLEAFAQLNAFRKSKPGSTGDKCSDSENRNGAEGGAAASDAARLSPLSSFQ